MSDIIFLDLDGTVVKEGTREEFYPGVFDKVRQLTNVASVYFFSCWVFNASDTKWLVSQFPRAKGFIQKPLGTTYGFVDNKIDLARCKACLKDVESS